MLRTVVYIRKSTDDHEDKQVHSLDRQWKDIQELIEYHNQNNPSEKFGGLFFEENLKGG